MPGSVVGAGVAVGYVFAELLVSAFSLPASKKRVTKKEERGG